MRNVALLFLCLLNCEIAQAGNHPRLHNDHGFSKLTPFIFLDEANYQLFRKALDLHENDAKRLTAIRDIYCDGNRAKIKVAQTVHFKPTVEKGKPVDEAQIEIKKQQGMAPFFYKNDFMYRSSGAADLSDRFLTHSVDKRANEPTNEAEYVSSSDYREFEQDHFYGGYDLKILFDNFTFRIPPSVVKEMYGIPGDDFYMNKFGYSKGKSFAASEAILFKTYIWRYVLIHDVKVKSAPKDDGTDYEVTWTPDLFCKYAVSIDDLRI